MDELLQKLLEADILNEDTSAELLETFNTTMNEAIEAAKADTAADVRAELTEQWINERDVLVEAVDQKVGDFVAEEIEELKVDIERFRDLEAEHAEKLVEAKAAMAAELKEDLVGLVERIDSFLEMRLMAEFEELREDITEVQKNEHGRKIFEAFKDEFAELFADEDDSTATLAETKRQLNDAQEALEEAETKSNAIMRTLKMAEVLKPLDGRSRDVMEQILKTVDTNNLEEGYSTFIGRVMVETEVHSEKEDKVLAENTAVDKPEAIVEGTVVTGDDEERLITESQDDKPGMSAERKLEIQKLAGM
jgi:vacuolar-type H+-ATPase subunit I/STV1